MNRAKLASGHQNDKTFLKIRLPGVSAWSRAPLGWDRGFPDFSTAQMSAITCIFRLLVPIENRGRKFVSSVCVQTPWLHLLTLIWLLSVGLCLPGGLAHSLEVCGVLGLQSMFPAATDRLGNWVCPSRPTGTLSISVCRHDKTAAEPEPVCPTGRAARKWCV